MPDQTSLSAEKQLRSSQEQILRCGVADAVVPHGCRAYMGLLVIRSTPIVEAPSC